MNSNGLIDQLIKERGLTRYSLAERIGVTEGTIRSGIKTAFANTAAGTLYKIAKELGISIESLLGKTPLSGELIGDAAGETFLPIRYVTGGGGWVDVDDYMIDEPRMHQAIIDPRFRLKDQWYEELRGDSMDRLIPNGALMHAVDAAQIKFKHGDIVVVERTRDNGGLIERSAKQVAFTAGGPELWPRSTNPKWRGPILLNEHEGDDTVSVRIAAVVLRAVIDTD